MLGIDAHDSDEPERQQYRAWAGVNFAYWLDLPFAVLAGAAGHSSSSSPVLNSSQKLSAWVLIAGAGP
jgi:hypothetical protein